MDMGPRIAALERDLELERKRTQVQRRLVDMLLATLEALAVDAENLRHAVRVARATIAKSKDAPT